jgi:hypothetical protein
MTPGDALGGGLTQQQPDGTRKGQTPQMPQPQPNLDIYGGMTPGDALGGGLTMKQPQQQPQMSQLLSVMPPDFAAQITPAQLAALTPDQMTQMIAKFSQPQQPMQTTMPVIRSDRTVGNFQSPQDMYSNYANAVFGSNAPSPQFQSMSQGKM